MRNEWPCRRAHLWPAGTLGRRWAASKSKVLQISMGRPQYSRALAVAKSAFTTAADAEAYDQGFRRRAAVARAGLGGGGRGAVRAGADARAVAARGDEPAG